MAKEIGNKAGIELTVKELEALSEDQLAAATGGSGQFYNALRGVCLEKGCGAASEWTTNCRVVIDFINSHEAATGHDCMSQMEVHER